MKYNLSALILALLIAPAAYAGKETGNGGNPRGLEFKALAMQALDELSVSGIGEATQDRLSRLRQALDSAIILSVDKPLIVNVNGIEQDCAVVNIPDVKSILISDKWDAITDSRIKRAITLHELEGLLNEEATGTYKLSAAYLLFTGYRGDSSSALDNAKGLSTPKKKPGLLEDYLCYEDESKQTGIDISVNHADLIVYTVGLRAQNGGMYSDGDGRQSIVTFREERDGQSGHFSLEGGTVVPDSAGRYSEALGFVRIDFRSVNGFVDSFVGIKSDGSRKLYINCSLRYSRD